MSRVRVHSDGNNAYQKEGCFEEAPPEVNESLPYTEPHPVALEENTKVRLAIQVSNAAVPGAHASNQAVRPKPSQSQLLEKTRMKDRQMSRDYLDRESLRPEPLSDGEEQPLDTLFARMDELQKDANMQDNLEEARNKQKRKRCLLWGFIILIVVVGIIIGVTVGFAVRGVSSEDSDNNVAIQASISDACYAGSASDQSAHYKELRSFLPSQLWDLHAEIDTAGSVARAALCWLTEVDDIDINIFERGGSDITQRFSLAYVYFHFVGLTNKDSHRLSLWNSLGGVHVCKWEFVDCNDIANKVVTGLNLERMQLNGKIPKHLALLSDLVSLNLRFNELTGKIPSELFQLTQLKILTVHSNQLSGHVPSDTIIMAKLRYLDLSLNKLIGTLPSDLGSSLQLELLKFHDNVFLTGTVPSLSGMSNLEILRMDRTSVEGPFPDISGCSKLGVMNAADTSLTGTVPTYVWTFPKLVEIDLTNAFLSGTIPYQIGELALSLERIYVSESRISGSIPTTFGNLSSLRYIDLHATKIKGTLPTEFGRLTNLEYLRLPYGITGTVPEEVCLLLDQSLRTLISPSRLSCHCCTEIIQK